jgi:hypothetical protein
MVFKSKISKTRSSACPKCRMGMIVVDGFGLNPEHKTLECLQCGRIVTPIKLVKRGQAAE